MLHAANYILKSTERVKEWKDNIDSDSAVQAHRRGVLAIV